MNIVLNAFTNQISLYKAGNKKTGPYTAVFEAQFSLNSADSCMHAVSSFLAENSLDELKKERFNTLIIPDYPVGFGTFSLPRLSIFKIYDVFATRFKSCYPDFGNYYLKHKTYHKGEDDILRFYTFARKPDVVKLVDLFKKNGIHITGIDYFAHYVISGEHNKNNYPMCYLFVGKGVSEFVLSKGKEILSISTLSDGEDGILNKQTYIDSPYFLNNARAVKYAAFMRESIMTKKELNDSTVDSTDPSAILPPKPRALRMLKGQSLEAYLLKNSVRKYCSFINDLTNYFSQDPWFIPISEIRVFSTDEFFNDFSALSKESMPFSLIKANTPIDKVSSIPGRINFLFRHSLKKERRTIDWKKFLSMDIGRKKKA